MRLAPALQSLLCIMAVFTHSGCVAVVMYAPSAKDASFYTHNQTASNMVVNQDIPVNAVKELTGITGVQFKNNSVKGAEINHTGRILTK